MTPVLTSDTDGSARKILCARGRGRPTRFNEILGEAICRDIAAGVPVSKAFLCNGISSRTGFNWTRYRPEFARAIADAQVRYYSLAAADGRAALFR